MDDYDADHYDALERDMLNVISWNVSIPIQVWVDNLVDIDPRVDPFDFEGYKSFVFQDPFDLRVPVFEFHSRLVLGDVNDDICSPCDALTL